MKGFKYIACVLAGTVLISEAFAGNALQTQVWNLQNGQDATQKQIKNLYKQIKKVQGGFPKLNNNIQKQLKDMDKQNQSQLKQLQKGIQSQLDQLNKTINQINQRLAKKGI